MKMLTSKARKSILVIGDILILWMGLFITLISRYPTSKLDDALLLHILPFSIIYAVWILIFYITGLYEIRGTHEIPNTLKLILYAALLTGAIATALFYFAPLFLITPKINLMIDLVLSTALLISWRVFFIRSARRSLKTKVLLVGSSTDIEELAGAIKTYPQLGFEIAMRIESPEAIIAAFESTSIDIVVAPRELQSNEQFVHVLYSTIASGIRFIDAAMFYERILGKIPVALISKVWFLENIAETEKTFFEFIKRGIDILFSLIISACALIVLPVVALCIALDSRGPIFIRQKRIGRMGIPFTLYKFRTMQALGPDGLAETNGAVWAEKNDTRVTRVGKFLRATRIDELPQLWNILKGELSFIGPRPERPEFVAQLRKEIPFYDMRHLVQPGLSGWAQTNPPFYYRSNKEAMLKLQYDLYYIKNRDLGLDLDITLKTLMVIFSGRGR